MNKWMNTWINSCINKNLAVINEKGLVGKIILSSKKNSKVLLLGAGGAARAIVAGFKKEGADEIIIANRTKENGEKLGEFSKSKKVKLFIIRKIMTREIIG